MKYKLRFFSAALLVGIGLIALIIWQPWSKQKSEDRVAMYEEDQDKRPHDWFYMQRAYPNRLVNEEARLAAYNQALAVMQEHSARAPRVYGSKKVRPISAVELQVLLCIHQIVI